VTRALTGLMAVRPAECLFLRLPSYRGSQNEDPNHKKNKVAVMEFHDRTHLVSALLVSALGMLRKQNAVELPNENGAMKLSVTPWVATMRTRSIHATDLKDV
jgi:hypothetical protein